MPPVSTALALHCGAIHSPADRIALQPRRRTRPQQLSELFGRSGHPSVEILRIEHHRHMMVLLGHHQVSLGRDDGAGLDSLIRPFPSFP
jgi:hypothetical protein